MQCKLTPNNKVDVFNPVATNGSWCIGTIKSNQNDECVEVQVDGTDTLLRISDRRIERSIRSCYNHESISTEWKFLRQSGIDESIASLNTHTLNHYYTHNPSSAVCIQSKQFGICSQCDTKCCTICNLCQINDDLYCSQCVHIYINDNDDDIKDTMNLFCSLCRSWLTKNGNNKCIRCHTIYCNKCGIIQAKLCKKCEIRCKQRKYSKSMKNAIGYDIGYDITYLITSFCMGHIIYCSNMKCYNMISINNQTELENGMDSECNKIYQYKVRRVFASAFYEDSTCYLYGKLRRVFCSECTHSKLKTCLWGALSYWGQRKEIICNNYDVTECCKNHAYCGHEAQYWRYTRDAEHHLRPSCQYDMELWINTEGRMRKCKWCSDTKHLFMDRWDYDDDDWYYDWWWDDYFWFHDFDKDGSSKDYSVSKALHRKRGLYFDRDMMKNNKYNKKAMRRVNKTQKRRSYIKRKKDKKGSCESKRRFKKRYQLSLQY